MIQHVPLTSLHVPTLKVIFILVELPPQTWPQILRLQRAMQVQMLLVN
ncbi:hypothetical protein KR52_06260 [Synechococcus sp. KORDI-52]|nr:hypothetical protein KR52_06260 [Synechococcus sp. KORDI-52]